MISIIIPVYNTTKERVDDCLNSIFVQQDSKKEVILIDDGSEVDYTDVVSKYKELNYVKLAHKGVSFARNYGILHSNGKYLLFVDSDDKMVHDSLKKIYKILDNQDVILSKSYINNNGNYTESFCYKNYSFTITNKTMLLKRLFVSKNKYFSCTDTPWAKVYKKSFLLENTIFFDETLTNCEDVLFNYNTYFKAKNIFFLNELTYVYVYNPNSVCNTYCDDMDNKFIRVIEKFNYFLKNNGIKDKYFDYFVLRIVVRLFRKYYIYLKNFDDFKVSIIKILDNEVIVNSLDKLNYKLDENQTELLHLLRDRNIINLYLFTINLCKECKLNKL